MVRSFGKGWAAALQMPGVILLKYILNVIGAAGVAVPIFFTFRDFFGDSAVTEDMFATMPIGGLAEFLFAEEGALVRSFLATVPLIIVFLLVNLFITGGILQRIALGRRMPWAEFFASSARLFPVLLVIELMNAFLFAAVVVLPYIGLSKAHEWIIDGAITPTPGKQAPNNSGRCVITAPTNKPPLLRPRCSSAGARRRTNGAPPIPTAPSFISSPGPMRRTA